MGRWWHWVVFPSKHSAWILSRNNATQADKTKQTVLCQNLAKKRNCPSSAAEAVFSWRALGLGFLLFAGVGPVCFFFGCSSLGDLALMFFLHVSLAYGQLATLKSRNRLQSQTRPMQLCGDEPLHCKAPFVSRWCLLPSPWATPHFGHSHNRRHSKGSSWTKRHPPGSQACSSSQ